MHKEAAPSDRTQSLLDALKQDQSLSQRLFGHLQPQSIKDLNQEDKFKLSSLGLKVQEYYDAELDKHDCNAGAFTIKFISFKTPSSGYKKVSKMFFTFKFFSFKSLQTNEVSLYSKQSQTFYLVQGSIDGPKPFE
jgi:hypothetical protein